MNAFAKAFQRRYSALQEFRLPAFRFQISDKNKIRPIAVAASEDFVLGTREEFDPSLLAHSKQWTLYAIDLEKRQVIFVEMPTGTDLGDAPFAYAAQFEKAQSVAVLQIDTFVALGLAMKPTATLAMLYSTGRCGSTLASRILAKIPGVWSISEPDCLTNLVYARHAISAEFMDGLLGASRAFICNLAPDVSNIVVKPRSEQVFLVDAFSRANPETNNVFMYRDAAGYANSMFRLVQRATGNRDFLTDPAAPQLGWRFASANAPKEDAKLYLRENRTEFDNLEAIVLGWTLRVRAIEAAARRGVQVKPLHFADLTGDKRKQTEFLLSACAIDAGQVEAGLQAFERDAHDGSATSNTVPTIDLNPSQRSEVTAMLKLWQQSNYLDDRLELES